MRSDRQRGREGTWLRDVRTARYSNVRKACAELQRLTGHRIHYSAWAAYEAGSRPIGDQHLAWLEEFFGPMPEEPAAGAPDIAALAKSISDLAAALQESMAAADRREAEFERKLVDVVEALGLKLAAERDGNGHGAPAGSVR